MSARFALDRRQFAAHRGGHAVSNIGDEHQQEGRDEEGRRPQADRSVSRDFFYLMRMLLIMVRHLLEHFFQTPLTSAEWIMWIRRFRKQFWLFQPSLPTKAPLTSSEISLLPL